MVAQDTIDCKVCAAPAEFLCITPNEHSATATLHHFRCTDCGLVFVGDSVRGEELAEAYGSLNYEAYYREIATENWRKMESSLNDLELLVGRGSRLIDIGAGDGSFLRLLLERGFTNVAGHEIPGADLPKLAPGACPLYFDSDYRTVPAGTFDAATLLDVAEHVPDPRHLFESCCRVLKPGGLLYVHTPVVARMDRLMHRVQRMPLVGKMGRIWQRGRTSIFHLQNYTARGLARLLEETGFDDISVVVKNELSWPVRNYVRVFLCEKQGLPTALAPLAAPFFYPFLATNLLNANKAIVTARKRSSATKRRLSGTQEVR